MLSLGENLSLLRKQKKMTQEELAVLLGVTNQSVSKWESGLCCPDITLLPEIAKLYQVSVDELLGYQPSNTSQNFLIEMKKIINESKEKEEDAKITWEMASELHALYFSKMYHEKHSYWNYDQKEKLIGKKEWGYSSITNENISTVMFANQVFFSDNHNILWPSEHKLRIASKFLSDLSDYKSLLILITLYRLTYMTEDIFVSAEELSEACKLTTSLVEEYLNHILTDYIETQTVEGQMKYHIYGSKLIIINVLMMLSDIFTMCN